MMRLQIKSAQFLTKTDKEEQNTNNQTNSRLHIQMVLRQNKWAMTNKFC